MNATIHWKAALLSVLICLGTILILAAINVLLSSCASPPADAPSCEEARAESEVLQPMYACRLEAWPAGYTVFPLPKGIQGADVVDVGDGTGAVYAAPVQYNTVLDEPGILAATPDGNCAWMPCHGGVP